MPSTRSATANQKPPTEDVEQQDDIISRMVKEKQGLAAFVETSDDEDHDSVQHVESESEDDSADEEEQQLEQAVFGDLLGNKVLEGLSKAKEQLSERKRVREQDELFVVDTDTTHAVPQKEENELAVSKTAAWVDEDDSSRTVALRDVNRLRKLRKLQEENQVSGAEYEKRLRAQHRKLNGDAKWATVEQTQKQDSDEEDDEEQDILRTSGSLTMNASKLKRLPPGRLAISRLNDANQQAVSKSVVQSIDWHKGGQLLATAGFDKTVRVFQIDGKVNAKVESAYFRDMPIFDARFIGLQHDELIIVGRRPFFYWMDLGTGSVGKIPGVLGRTEKSWERMAVSPDGSLIAFPARDGNIIFVSQKTKQYVGKVKMNSDVYCTTFSSDGKTLFSSGSQGDVYCWDMNTRRLKHRFQDQGSIITQSLAVTSDNRRLAIGSNNGVVNLYDVNTALESRSPEPLKAVMSLTTPINRVSFSHDGQLLAMSSREKKDSLRLFNMNSLSVVPNWPTAGTPLGYVSDVAFSPTSSMITTGNDKGRCLLYRIQHYTLAR
mmetsp:Transcript_19942/g.32855  ORF Transcript_19942/g.32855 Transcript_19942/m.32855 type:complete len:548 (+) Transcript_19942:26-1669(+)|eukprot:CAMPEP_0203759516 /NCGR_PEP_ID=MMETSP0098-20131031/12557_1 /ASSEMBLY_ACC=CAM_ASM_000208 /TAXON_ID=96639 /ORGANISM=" , Strain NY0313808BC1" /LENGTH=547 /DNA_ID=CAMNT_0050652525 /DNA_START=8 /DNA_END=1651 /DNA_ORIENTATION=-